MIDRDLRLREIILIAAAAYVAWTPIYFLAKPAPVIVPDGERVEIILPVGSFADSGKVTRRLGFKQRDNEVESTRPLVIYEDAKPLPSGSYEFAPFNPKNRWREVKFASSDGSDPRYNGRRYYAVLEPEARSQ